MDESADTFLFLPDISGFTAFVNQTEINHSHHILQELMEILLETNLLDLEVSEIEGDAVFFFKKGNLPDFQQIYHQSEAMFLAFHNHLKAYEAKRICKCGACSTASNLTIKFVAHAGQAQPIQIKNHSKLHGHDVILSHRLLKNNIPASEYLLLTDALLKKVPQGNNVSLTSDSGTASSEQYDFFDEVAFRFYDLHPLHQKTQDHPSATFDEAHFHGKTDQTDINTDPVTLYDIVSNLKYRQQWNKRVKRLYFNDQELNHAGNNHTCVMNNMNLNIQTLPVDTSGEDIIYAERIQKMGMLREVRMVFTISDNKNGQSHAELEMNFQFVKKWLEFLRPVVNLYVKKMLSSMLKDLKIYAEKHHITEPVELTYSSLPNKANKN